MNSNNVQGLYDSNTLSAFRLKKFVKKLYTVSDVASNVFRVMLDRQKLF